MDAQMDYARKNPNKIRIVKMYVDSPYELATFLAFLPLSEDDLHTLGSFKSKDWMSYGAMKEQEYFCNRNKEDIPVDERNDDDEYNNNEKKILRQIEFLRVKKNNPSSSLTYSLYLRMRECEK
jgi:hypothetical protein